MLLLLVWYKSYLATTSQVSTHHTEHRFTFNYKQENARSGMYKGKLTCEHNWTLIIESANLWNKTCDTT